MVLNITFNNISVISWQAILLVEQTGVVYLVLTCVTTIQQDAPLSKILLD
jgi:hypothetical protein